MEDCSWLYGVYEETAGVINMGLMMVRLMFIDCGSDINSCSDVAVWMFGDCNPNMIFRRLLNTVRAYAKLDLILLITNVRVSTAPYKVSLYAMGGRSNWISDSFCNRSVTKPLVKDEEASDVDVHLYRSMIGSLMYLTASRPDIMYLKGKPKLGLWYPKVSLFDLKAYSDSDYAGANLDRKSTTSGCQFLVLWIQNQMLDYGFNFMNTKIYIDNEITICIVKNPVYHSKTKHIAIRHHFIRDSYEKKLIQVLKIHTDDNVADLLTKSSLGFRESLRRVLDGTEALMLPTLFILWLATVSTDSAELVPLGKVSTAIETLKKNTAKGGRATQTTQIPTSTIFGDDETIAQVLINMSQAKVVSREKEKGVEFKDAEETEKPRPTSTRSLLTLKPLLKIDPKDKGKKKIEEEDESESESDGIPEAEKKFKQLASDEEMARKVQEEWEGKEERKRLAEEEATNDALIRNYDDIKARIEADRLLAEKLQEEEREQFTIEERAKFLHDTIAAQRKFLAQQRSEAIRNRPPTKNQLRNQMMTYLKHVGNFKHSDLKTKKFEEIQALYEKIKRSDEDFISIGSAEDERLIKKMNEKGIDSSKNEMVKEEDKEEEYRKSKERRHSKGTIDSEIMERKYVIARLDKGSSPDGDYLVIYRANRNFRPFNYLMEGDLKIMMESSKEENDQSDF
ncbi:hypothetical protein Tco_0650816, partial [Tanacetum coccineum]